LKRTILSINLIPYFDQIKPTCAFFIYERLGEDTVIFFDDEFQDYIPNAVA
jgi:hypothetical protein